MTTYTRIRTHSEVCSKVNIFEDLFNSKITELDFEDYALMVVDYKAVTIELLDHSVSIMDVANTSYEDCMKISNYLPKGVKVEFPEEYTTEDELRSYFIENATHYYTYGSCPW